MEASIEKKWRPRAAVIPRGLYTILTKGVINSVQFSSVAQSCPTLCDPVNRSTPGLPVHCEDVTRQGGRVQASRGGKLWERVWGPCGRQGSLSEVCCADSGGCLLCWCMEGKRGSLLYKWKFTLNTCFAPCFQRGEGQRASPTSTVSMSPLAEAGNNPPARVVYLGVAYPQPFKRHCVCPRRT